jgi:hypothetical protein
MERDQRQIPSRAQGVDRAGDLGLAWQKDQHVVVALAAYLVQGALQPRLQPLDVGQEGRARQVARLDRIDPPRRMKQLAAQVRGDPIAGHGGGHHYQPSRATLEEEGQ